MHACLTSIVLFANSSNDVAATLKTIGETEGEKLELIILANAEFNKNISGSLKADTPIKWVTRDKQQNLGAALNEAFKVCEGTYILLLLNENNRIELKLGAISLFRLAGQRNPFTSMIYSDYEQVDSDGAKDVHLLKHHIGRVRDNQDYGFVFYIGAAELKEAGYCDEKLKTNTIYDLRLRLSAVGELQHIANRYAGSLYVSYATGNTHNVFDYLLASKESQLEAEDVLTKHLARIGAKLDPGAHLLPRPKAPQDVNLKASVIIPVNNRPEFISTAIESVQAQTVQDVEVIVVVNGGPDDPTVPVVKQYMAGGSKYDAQKPAVELLIFAINNLGLCLNMGAAKARGAYYVQLDSDDRLKPNAVEKILKVYEEDPMVAMVIGSYDVWEKKADGQIVRMDEIGVVTHDEWTEENGRNNLLRINGAGAPRSLPIQVIREIGFSVNEEPFARNYGEDYNMVLRVSEQHRIGRVWDAIYDVIRHSGGTDHNIDQATIDRNDEAKDYMRKEAILRRIALNKNV